MATTSESPLDSLAALVTQGYLDAKPGPSEVTDAAASVVYGYLFPALEGADDPPAVCAAAAAGALAGAKKQVSPIWHVARGALIGAIHAGLGRRLELAPLVRASTASLMGGADAAGADFGAAAQGAVEGAITAADELGLDETELAAVAASAALEAAEGLGEGALEKIRHLVQRPILGVSFPIPDRYAPEHRTR